MLTVWLLLFGAVLLALSLADRAVRRLPLTPSLIYLAVGWVAGALLGAPSAADIEAKAPLLAVVVELAVLVSLFAVGVRLGLPPTLRAWKVALCLAGPGVVVAIAAGTLAAAWLLQLPWAAALLLAAVMAPTDPVLASEVQIRSDDDGDAVRLSLTAEGALNDGSALPAVMLGLGLLGLHPLGDGGVWGSARWWWHDMLWPIGGGGVLGIALGWGLGHVLRWRSQRGDTLARDELLYVGAVALACGLARATQSSTFVLVFAMAATLLEPLRRAARPNAAASAAPLQHVLKEASLALSARLHAFGARIERLVEAATVLAVGVALHSVQPSIGAVAFALVLIVVVRPLSVLAVVRLQTLARGQRRLVAWFGIRGIGTLFYLVFVLEHGVAGELAADLIGATLTAIALSIMLHGVSATPLMARHHRRRQPADANRR